MIVNMTTVDLNCEIWLFQLLCLGSCSTSDEPNVPPKKPKQRRESLSSTERLQIKRERNRIGAKNTRVKKKQYLEVRLKV